MEYLGYYEIINYKMNKLGLKAHVIAGNVEFNRLNWHNNLEIFCCIHGSVSVNVQGIVYNLEEGDLITIDRNLSHEIFNGTQNGLQLIFSVDESLLQVTDKERYVLSTVGKYNLAKDHKDICTVRSSIAQLACMLMLPIDIMENPIDPHMLRTIPILDTEEKQYQFHMEVYRILMLLARHKEIAQSPSPVEGPGSHVVRCIEKIHKDYGQLINTKILAEEIGFSETTIYRLFQKHLGVSPNHYINSFRISVSCGLIENTDAGMTEIASQCGFSSLSNFYRTFHQFLGMSPRAYQKNRGLPHHPHKQLQQDIMLHNRFQVFWELPYTIENLEQIAASITSFTENL